MSLRPGRRRAAAALTALALLAGCAADQRADRCPGPGDWISPAGAGRIAPGAVLAAAGRSRIALLGELHSNAEHHRWQAYMLAALHARHPNMVLGFEMLPRSVQPVLDEWARGALDEKSFLEKSRWNEVWGYDSAFYLPLLHFVRQHRLRAVALNVERALVSRVGREGWQAVPPDARAGLGDPAPASPAYRRALAEIYAERAHRGGKPGDKDEPPDIDRILAEPAFDRFVDAQLVWDRAMAEALAGASRRDPGALVVGIVGSGHVRNRHGIPHQLDALGIRDVAVLIAAEPGQACGELPGGLADAVFVVAPVEEAGAPPARPRLGVMIADASDGVRVNRVLPDTVAEAAGLANGDVILSAAGFRVRKVSELIDIIRRQAPGTWLPLRYRRNGKEGSAIAKFPRRFGGGK